MPRFDFNCDMGESFGAWTMGLDAEVIRFVTSANIACGFHAGDPATMRKTVALAEAHGVGIGAHPGFPDLQGFGRRNLAATPDEVRDDLVYQIGALTAFTRAQEAAAREAARRALQHGGPGRRPGPRDRRSGARGRPGDDPRRAGRVEVGRPGRADGAARRARGVRRPRAERRRDARAAVEAGRGHPRHAAGHRAERPAGDREDRRGDHRRGGARARPTRSACTATRRTRSRWPRPCRTALEAAGVVLAPLGGAGSRSADGHGRAALPRRPAIRRLVVEFGDAIDPAINRRVRELFLALDAARDPGRSSISSRPTARSSSPTTRCDLSLDALEATRSSALEAGLASARDSAAARRRDPDGVRRRVRPGPAVRRRRTTA